MFLIPLFLCWGSFLNVVAYRLITELSVVHPRSFCPQCKHMIAWYDNIPIISWIFLFGRCRNCSKPISFLYPFIELFTAYVLTTLYFTVPFHYFPTYFCFFSALIVTIRSDIETMLISRFVSIFLIPLAWLFIGFNLLPISFIDSIAGIVVGYGFLFVVAQAFRYFTGKEGIGQGDLELLAMIGSFIGVAGCWVSLFLGSIIGSMIGVFYITFLAKNKAVAKLPFGPFLSLGAIAYVLMQETLINLIFGF